jgi:hypothetical protein
MLDRPDATDLLRAIGAFIVNDVVPELTGRKRFHALVAANLTQILAREAVLAPDNQRDEIVRLRELLGHAADAPLPDSSVARNELERELSAELVGRIEAGDADDGAWGEAVFSYLKATVAGKLRIDNPSMLGTASDGDG